MKLTILFLGILISTNLLGQQPKKIITPEAYSKWKAIGEPQISDKGNIISYAPKQQIGDNKLIIENRKDNTKRTFDRGFKAKINAEENWVVFSIANYYDSIRALKINKTPKKKWPKDTLAIYIPARDSLVTFSKVKSYKTAKETKGNWIGIHRTEDFGKDTKKKKKNKKKKKTPVVHGSILTLYNPLTSTTKHYKNIDDYTINNNGNIFFWAAKKTYNDTIDSTFIYRYNTSESLPTLINKQQGYIKKLTSSYSGDQFAYLFSSDTASNKTYTIYYWNTNLSTSEPIQEREALVRKKKSVSEHFSPYFSENGNYLFYGIGKQSKAEQKDTLTDDEKYSLDLWSWTDDKLQPQQLKNLSRDKKRSDTYVFLTDTKSNRQLTDSSLNIRTSSKKHNEQYLLATSQTLYLKEMTWDGWYYDYYKINIESGEKTLLLKHQNDQLKLSPSGNQIVYYLQKDSAWYHHSILDNKTKKITTNKLFHNQYHDVPGTANSSGGALWSKDEQFVLIKGQYDYWLINCKTSKIEQFTYGRKQNTEYSYWNTSEDKTPYIDLSQPIYFKTYNEKTKKEGIAKHEGIALKQLFVHDRKIISLIKAKQSDKIIIRESSFTKYPDLQLTNLKFNHFEQLTDINPQQKDFNWGTVELINWKSYHNADSLSGLLYKPENFDSSKTYPMIIYFYERNSHNFHRYYAPKPTASIIYPTEYASNGYIVFIPDVKYETGEPAQGAYDCIVSGTDYLTKKFKFIDSTRIGIQGQSWGGYQTAQLITMTNKYKCAMAGAPVSNMFSAYGGIRWGSGLNRAFQYERGQSRIGQTIWDAPELYIKNSPIFHLPKVSTPLLIMHNDGDGAVPWYQGIELFNGLRRLQKPVWMLNYNDDAHNLKRRANKVDLSIRMKAFFDYYLMDKKEPNWMKNGRPALIKEEQIYNPY